MANQRKLGSPDLTHQRLMPQAQNNTNDVSQSQAEKGISAGQVAEDNDQPKDQQNRDEDPWTVKWEGKADPADPLNTPYWKKWALTIVLAFSAFCVAACSAVGAFTRDGLQADFGISKEVATLSVSLFVIGFDSGSRRLLFVLGPLSEFHGRAGVLHGAFALFWLLQFPVAFANNAPVHLVFRLMTGLAGSAFLTVSGGAVSDVFRNDEVGTPMMFFSAAPFIGGVAPVFAGFINQNTTWRWTYYLFIIWAFVLLILLLAFVPETYDKELLRRKAVKLRKDTGEKRWIAPVERTDRTFRAAFKASTTTPFWLMFTQPMVLLLDLWSSLILGILYLSFGGIPYVFMTQYNFSLQQTGMVFIGLGVGQCAAVATQPYFNRKYKVVSTKHNGKPPPEERLKQGCWGAILCPLGLILMGLLSFKNVPWILPILATTLFGAGMIYSFNSTFTYLVDAYRPVAASALASNTFLRGLFAAGFPLFGDQMYERLGAVGGTCLLGGLMCLATPLPFVFYRIGARIRCKSECCDQS